MQSNNASVSGRRAVILTAIRPEYLAVRAHLQAIEERTHPRGTVYETGTFECSPGDAWSVALVETGVGNPTAAFETERAASFFTPSVMMFVGVAGGLKDVQLGDVVVATKVYGYESGKAKARFEPRPNVGESSYSLVQGALAEARKDDWTKRLLCSPIAKPRVFVGPIAAGEKVVASRRGDVFRFLSETYSDALAVEMEGRGFLHATHANESVRALIVRGVSDLLSRKAATDNAGYQDRAAENAAAFAFEVLARLDVQGEELGEYAIVLAITTINRAHAEALLSRLREITGDARLTLRRIDEGSVRLVIEGSRHSFEILNEMLRSGRLAAELGVEVADLTWPFASARIESRVGEINHVETLVGPVAKPHGGVGREQGGLVRGPSDTTQLLIECLSSCYNLSELRNACLSLLIPLERVFAEGETVNEAAHKLVYTAYRTRKLLKLALHIARRNENHPLLVELVRRILEVRREQVLVSCTANVPSLEELIRTVRAFGSEVFNECRSPDESQADYSVRLTRRIRRSVAHLGIIGEGETTVTTSPIDEHFASVYTLVQASLLPSWIFIPFSIQGGPFLWIVKKHPDKFLIEYRDSLDLHTKVRRCLESVKLRLD